MTDLATISIVIDSTGAKQGAQESVQALGQVKGAATSTATQIQGLTAVQQKLVASYEVLRRQVQSGIIGQQEFQSAQQRILDQLQKTSAATKERTETERRVPPVLDQTSRAVQHQINQLKGLGIEAQRAAAQSARLADLQTRLQQATQQTTTATQRLSATVLAEVQALRQLGQASQAAAASGAMNAAAAQNARLVMLQGRLQTVAAAKQEAAAVLVANQASTRAAQAFGLVGAASVASTAGVSRLRNSLMVMSLAAAGLPGTLGRVVSSLGLLTLGGGIATAVVVGIGAIVVAWQKLTEKSREAKQATDNLIASLIQARRERLGLDDLANEAQLKARQADLVAKARREAGAGGGQFDQLFASGRATAGELARLGVSQGTIQGFKDVTAALLEFQSQYEDSWKEMTDAATAAQEAADAKAEASFKARIARIEQLWDALGGAREPNVAVGGLSGQALADSVAQRRAARAPLQAVPLPGAFGTGNTANEIAFRKLTAAREQETAAALKQIQATKEARLEALRFAAALGILPAGLGAAAYALVEMLAKVQELKVAGLATGKAIAQGVAIMVASVAASLITGKSVGASVARGAIGGAAAGTLIAPGIGTLIGGAVGAIGGLFSGNKAKKEAEARRRQEIAAFGQEQAAFVEQGKAAGRSPLEQQLKELATQFKALEAEAKRLKQSTRELQVSYAQQRAALREAFAEEQRQYQAAIEVRRLAAEGLSVEAAALALSVQQQQELTAAQKAGYDAATIAALQYVQALEAEAAAKAAVITEQRKAADAADFEAGLTLRETALKGDAAAAEITRLNQEADAAKRRAAILLATGDITQEQFDRLIAVLGGELTRALSDLATVAARAAEQLAAAERAASQDLDVRLLQATGKEAEATDLRFQLQQERERAGAIEGQSSVALLAKLDEVLAAEKAQYEQNKLRSSRSGDLPGGIGDAGDEGVGAMKGAMVTTVERTAFATMEAAGYLASMNIYLREISFHTAVLRSGTAPAQFAGGFNYGAGGTASAASAVAGAGSITLVFTIPAEAFENPTVLGQVVLDQLDTALGQRATLRTGATGSPRTL